MSRFRHLGSGLTEAILGALLVANEFAGDVWAEVYVDWCFRAQRHPVGSIFCCRICRSSETLGSTRRTLASDAGQPAAWGGKGRPGGSGGMGIVQAVAARPLHLA